MKPNTKKTHEYGVTPNQPDFSDISVLVAARIERADYFRKIFTRLSRWIGRGLIAPVTAMRRRQRVYDELTALDDHTLADIGITRGDIPCLANDCANLGGAGDGKRAKAA